MSCVHETVKQLFRRSEIDWPRNKKFRRLETLLLDEFLDASDQAKILCLFLKRIEKKETNRYSYIDNSHAFVFIHPNRKARGIHASAHCLGLHHNDRTIERYCSWENNWRNLYEDETGFKFNTKDWTTSIADKYIKKPFLFSFFITNLGYSLWVNPRNVLGIMENGNHASSSFHDFPYKSSWENKYD